ncbi:hypothetical protein ACLB2K_007457 [Fragaria x ananassa]
MEVPLEDFKGCGRVGMVNGGWAAGLGKGCIAELRFHLSVKVHGVINDLHHGAECRGKWEFHKIETLLLAPIVSTCFVPSREGVARRSEVEFLGPSHGTCTSDSVTRSGLGWLSLRLSDA